MIVKKYLMIEIILSALSQSIHLKISINTEMIDLRYQNLLNNTIFNILISMMEFKIGIILKNFTRKMIKKDLNKMA